MRNAFLLSALFLSTSAMAARIDPVDFPWFNGPTRDAVYRMTEHTNSVHVFEAFTLSCSWCNRNAEQVQAMAEEFAAEPRVQFIDLGLDTDDRNIARWVSTHNPSYPVVKDVNRTVYNALRQSNGVPQTFVVDCRGEMVDSTIGYWGDEEKETLRQAIATALATDCSTPNP